MAPRDFQRERYHMESRTTWRQADGGPNTRDAAARRTGGHAAGTEVPEGPGPEHTAMAQSARPGIRCTDGKRTCTCNRQSRNCSEMALGTIMGSGHFLAQEGIPSQQNTAQRMGLRAPKTGTPTHCAGARAVAGHCHHDRESSLLSQHSPSSHQRGGAPRKTVGGAGKDDRDETRHARDHGRGFQ